MMLTLLWGWAALSPAAAVDPGEVLLEKPAPEEKKEEAPTTGGPLISDTCLPIETHKLSLQVLWALAITGGNFSPNWRRVSAGGDFTTFSTSVKFTYGPAKNMEMYVVIPYIHNFASGLDTPGPGGERSADFGGVGDISAVGKYLLLEETTYMPAVTGVLGVGFPSGHAHHLNPGRLGTDGIGAGAFTFTTGVNLFKWLKPFLVHGQIWFNAPVNIFSGSGSVQSPNFMTFNLAMEYCLNKRWIALLEFYSTWTWDNLTGPQGFQSPATLLGVLPGIEFLATEKWSAGAGAAIDLFGKAGSYKYTPMFTVYYSF
jgi:hypothetical protein